MRVFLDTNVLASALATRGLCADVFEVVLAEHDLLTCQAVLDELGRILITKFRMPAELVGSYLELINTQAEKILGSAEVTIAVPDADDVPILAASLAGAAACFVTGDKALLELEQIGDMPIFSPRQFWEHYRLGR